MVAQHWARESRWPAHNPPGLLARVPALNPGIQTAIEHGGDEKRTPAIQEAYNASRHDDWLRHVMYRTLHH